MTSQLSADEETTLRKQLFREEPLFPLLCRPLCDLQPTFTQLGPVEIWIEAVQFTNSLLRTTEPEEELDFEIKDLQNKFGSEHIVIASTALLILSSLRKNYDVKDVATVLLEYCRNYQLYHQLIVLVKNHEERRQEQGKVINLWKCKITEIKHPSSTSSTDLARKLVDVFVNMPPEDAKELFIRFDWEMETCPEWDSLRLEIKKEIKLRQKQANTQGQQLQELLVQIADSTKRAADSPTIAQLNLGNGYQGMDLMKQIVSSSPNELLNKIGR